MSPWLEAAEPRPDAPREQMFCLLEKMGPSENPKSGSWDDFFWRGGGDIAI